MTPGSLPKVSTHTYDFGDWSKKCQNMCADSCLVPIFLSVLSPLWLDHLVYDSWWRLKCIPLIFSLLSVSADSAFGLGAWNAGQDDLLRFAETATQQSIKSAMMEMHSSVPSPGSEFTRKRISEQLTRGSVILGQIWDVMAFVCHIFFDCWLWTVSFWKVLAAESRAEQQMGRLRSELEQAELAAQAVTLVTMDFLSERKKTSRLVRKSCWNAKSATEFTYDLWLVEGQWCLVMVWWKSMMVGDGRWCSM